MSTTTKVPPLNLARPEDAGSLNRWAALIKKAVEELQIEQLALRKKTANLTAGESYATAASVVAVAGSSGVQIGGDIGGTDASPTVVGLQTIPLSSVAPSSGQMLQYNSTSGKWEAVSISAGSGVPSVDGITTAVTLSAGTGISITDNSPSAGDIKVAGSVFGASGSSHASGDVPDPGSTAGTTKFLREDATWQVPSGGGSGALVLLEQHAASGSAELDFTAWESSTYDDYLVEVIDLNAATNGDVPLLEFSTDGGSTWDTSANYGWAQPVVALNTGANSINYKYGDTAVVLFGTAARVGLLGAATPGMSCSFRLRNPANSSNYTFLTGEGMAQFSSNSYFYHFTFSGLYHLQNAVNAFRVLMSSGNIASGTIRVYGIAKA